MEYAIRIVEQSGRELTDYQVKVEITDEEFFSKCTDQRYVEFYDEDKQTLLPHYTELFDTANKKAVFWVKVPSIQANGIKMIYLNINTERTEDLSNPEAVFDFWDDFEGTEIDTTKWGGNIASFSIADSVIKCSESSKWIYTKTFQIADGVVEAKVKLDTGARGSLHARNNQTDTYSYTNVYSYNVNYRYPNGDVRSRKWVNGAETIFDTQSYSHDTEWHIARLKLLGSQITFEYEKIDETNKYSFTTTDTAISEGYIGLATDYIDSGSVYYDWVRVRKYTDPEPSVTVIRLGATPTYDLKLKIAQALAGEATTILDTDPKLRLLSGTDIIKELSLTAKTVYKDSVNNRVVVAFLFVDDSSDEYTADNLELLFTKDNTEYVAFKSNKSFTKVADKRLPLRWEIYLNYDVDVCTYEETMISCL